MQRTFEVLSRDIIKLKTIENSTNSHQVYIWNKDLQLNQRNAKRA